MKSERFFRLFVGRRHQQFNCPDDGHDLPVVDLQLLFELIELAHELFIWCKHLTQFHKGPDDVDTRLNRSLGVLYTCGHNGAMLGKNIREFSSTTPART